MNGLSNVVSPLEHLHLEIQDPLWHPLGLNKLPSEAWLTHWLTGGAPTLRVSPKKDHFWEFSITETRTERSPHRRGSTKSYLSVSLLLYLLEPSLKYQVHPTATTRVVGFRVWREIHPFKLSAVEVPQAIGKQVLQVLTPSLFK